MYFKYEAVCCLLNFLFITPVVCKYFLDPLILKKMLISCAPAKLAFKTLTIFKVREIFDNQASLEKKTLENNTNNKLICFKLFVKQFRIKIKNKHDTANFWYLKFT